ncbi:nicotinate-nucleotide--dimethylbenzimidazole phosphoribosyltransferase [Eisenibacter elegans]|jgi:nicotinate-nucleotide--dimethylbenzimidazole phosphoribosyltransferase|uniref:nicotinate-nucleotide--dimethylbenzimidazole phosphoribosyltransferase n=1 Tax=Eisenibacter elegans TaxID=997 RepID=UPI0005586A48|nr:nicotinate-nucleotide--dimethylbenzimidazole phosphoribosyltransferase [Eisenibacter elegans]
MIPSLTILPPDEAILPKVWHLINHKTKPLGALGALESLAAQIAWVQQSLQPKLQHPTLWVFAADHGAADAGLSAYPSVVTAQMVYNFVQNGAAINVLCRQHGIKLQVVDAGVAADFPTALPIVHQKIAKGTANYLEAPAMSAQQWQQALEKGAATVTPALAEGTNCVAFGEMGIGNTAAAALWMHLLTGFPLVDCVGRGTGLDDQGLARKTQLLAQALQTHGYQGDIIAPDALPEALRTFGGFEMVQMLGAMIQAAAKGALLLIDGFIATAVCTAAIQMYPALRHYCVFAHQSDEQGHRLLLAHLEAKPLLQLGMRLGEGSGAAAAFPLLQSAILLLNEMASFEQAGVSSANS